MLDFVFGTSVVGVVIATLALDLTYLGLIIAFFLLALAYLAGCGRLRKGADQK